MKPFETLPQKARHSRRPVTGREGGLAPALLDASVQAIERGQAHLPDL